MADNLLPPSAPRLVRRHYDITKFTVAKTRRQRKARARIIAAMKRRGELK